MPQAADRVPTTRGDDPRLARSPIARALLALLLLCLTVPALAQSQSLIVPGVSVGLLKLGDGKETIVNVLGKPELTGETETEPKSQIYQYYKKGLHVLLRANKVHLIAIQSSYFRTAEGVGVGSSYSEVESAMGGSPQKVQGNVGPELVYPTGIRFLFYQDQAVGVEVRPPAK